MTTAARLKDMKVLHGGQEVTRHVYFGAETTFVLIGRQGHEVQQTAPGVYATIRTLSDDEYTNLRKQAEADTYTAYQTIALGMGRANNPW